MMYCELQLFYSCILLIDIVSRNSVDSSAVIILCIVNCNWVDCDGTTAVHIYPQTVHRTQ